jgi:hypothetical protein
MGATNREKEDQKVNRVANLGKAAYIDMNPNDSKARTIEQDKT